MSWIFALGVVIVGVLAHPTIAYSQEHALRASERSVGPPLDITPVSTIRNREARSQMPLSNAAPSRQSSGPRTVKQQHTTSAGSRTITSSAKTDSSKIGGSQAAAAKSRNTPANPETSNNAFQQRSTDQSQSSQHDPKTLAQKFCGNIAAHAGQELLNWQSATLTRLKEEINGKIDELRQLQESQSQYERRQMEAKDRLSSSYVTIISRMRPDAAAAHLSAIDDAIAAKIVAQLEPKVASSIFNEMPASRAAKLADNMTGAHDASRKN